MLYDRVPSILIVEDEAIVAMDLQETLADMGYDPIAIAASADEALSRATERCPDIVLMDIRIRGQRDGIETAGLLRERFNVPIVYLTAHADDATLKRAKQTEPYGYLMKPVKAADLRSAIEISLYKHEMERRVRERERWFSTTLRSISDAVVTVDLAGNVTFMNATAEELTGVPATSAIGRPAREIVRLLDPAQPASPLDLVLEQRAAIRIEEAPLKHATRGPRIIADSASPVMDEDHMLGAVMVFRDVTEQKLVQKQLELTDRLASLGTMAAGVAHEVNNPLAVVTANASFVRAELEMLELAATADSSQLAAILEAQREIETAAARIARIVSELQAFARPHTPSRGEANVADAVQWAVRSTAHEFRYRARVIVEIDGALHVQLDETRLGQVLVNLMMNAAHSIELGAFDKNTVTIHARQNGNEVVVEVRDTGSGMSPELIKRVFEPFYTTKDVGVGTGLGLAICHGIVSSAAGKLEVESEPGVGSTFRIRLLVAVLTPRSEAKPAVISRVRRGKMLVIDDEPMMLKALRRLLRDHDVVTVTDPEDALKLLDRGERFDIVFSDMMMPSMTGMDLYERLLADHPDEARRVVFVTGGAVNARVADFLAVVPNACLEKPITMEELSAFVQQRLADQSESSPTRSSQWAGPV